jgi:hypothetical protein
VIDGTRGARGNSGADDGCTAGGIVVVNARSRSTGGGGLELELGRGSGRDEKLTVVGSISISG